MNDARLTGRIMRRIAAVERTRSRLWYAAFALVIGGCILSAVIFGYVTAQSIQERAIPDALGLFFEHPGIIAEYWFETAGTVIAEFPTGSFLLGLAFVLSVGISLYATKKHRSLLNTKEKELAKYRRTRNNASAGESI